MKWLFNIFRIQQQVIFRMMAVFLLLLMISCTEEMELEPAAYVKNIIIDATLTNENQYQLVRLFYTQSFTDDSSKMVEAAMVTVTSGDSVVRFIERDTFPGYYFSEIPFAGEPGKTYHLLITNVDINVDGEWDVFEASATMASALEMDSVTYTYIPQWKATSLNCYAWDPQERNYYNFIAWVNGVMVTDSLFEYNVTNDDQFNGNYTNGVTCQFLQDEKEYEHIENGDTLTLEIDNIDLAYFNYINSAQKEYYGYNPMFGGLPANVSSNISNNAIGIFRVYTVSKKSCVVKGLVR